MMPTRVPMATERAAASRPTSREIRAPQISRPSRERPNWSVPSGNSALGGSRAVPGASVTDCTSEPTISGAASASRAIRARPARP
ncbi:hypothetical protein STANM309S_01694 [Streptomyces tanashiensis]